MSDRLGDLALALNDLKKLFRCKLCGEEFDTQKRTLKHILNEHYD